ncbi:glycosyltransferase family 2 protein [Vibrio splendidus]|uniref:Glycosyltransferase family 2 protein n=1 Tax=Vibrio splendidus TaxID=29497 RepID=A0A7Y4G013_VIBSP|nr:glycosyltransferase family A protein [Vibrio splendidus]NOJ13175.1 glycosyltransferase family 2 protein [Vibrio splendidus]
MLSIVVPVYNSSETITSCLQSLVDQDGVSFDMEIIIVNDGSTDESSKLIHDFISKHESVEFTYIEKENGGVSSARNCGVENSKYKWIAFIDSDDVWRTDKLKKQFETINNSKFNIDFLGCARNNETLSIFGNKVLCLHKASVNQLLVRMFPQTSTALVKKAIFDKVGGYDESFTHAEDGDLWVRICNVADFYYMPDSLVTTGGGKCSFGESGLSANLSSMLLGNRRILSKQLKHGNINVGFYSLMLAYYQLKHVRRQVITMKNKLL